MADFWCAGDGEKAEALPRSKFNEILAVAIAQEQGKAIEAENDAREKERARQLDALRNGS